MADFWSAEEIKAPDGSVSVISAEDRECTLLENVIAITTLLSWFGFVYVGPWLTLWLVVTALCGSKAAITVLLIFVALSFVPPGDVWWAYRSLPLWDIWRRYFRVRLLTPPKDKFLQPDGHYLLAEFPHTVYPMGSWLGLPICGRPGTGIPKNLRGGIASVLFALPIIKHNYAWAGCMPAEYKRMLKHMREPGASLSVIPEGIKGIFLSQHPEREEAYLTRRKGFVKLAIQGGADLVPVYHLGQTQLLTFWGTESISRSWRMSVGLFWGAYGLPLPRKSQIISLVGAPIPVQQVENPTQEQIDELHAKFTVALQKLFDNNKHVLGPLWAKKKLHVI
ncbi:hypothetical protein CVIRNUC_009474 [Coccomyxa viridis]|uniref:Acyltransferase n=1 Tax=Coccomyxa viridis TaxID=1274662 RepID=A0AAV1IHZ3_9CHLO|nr:hypothetical protein CVIRNUC_009474 [Coccomyxa viridis]